MARIDVMPRPTWVIILLLIVVPMVSQAGSVPHTHSGKAPGLFNEDHDLALLAAANAVAIHEASPLLVTFILTAFVAGRSGDRAVSRPTAPTDSRAPPLR